MGRPNAEALLISALLTSGDITAVQGHGIAEHHFRGYSQEYGWLMTYYETYGEIPSVDAFCDKWPDFPFRNHENIRYAADEVLRDYGQAKITETISGALGCLRNGDLIEAQELLRSYEYRPASAIPADLVTSLSFLDDYDTPQRGLSVPWRSLQEATGGIRPGNFWIWAARPGQGKSAFLSDISVHNLLAGKRVLFYSLEMNDEEVRSRLHANLATRLGYANLAAKDILRRNVDLYHYKQFVNELPDHLGEGLLHVHTPADGPVSPSVVASRAADYDLVVIDYLTLMCTDAGIAASEDWRTAAQISNRLKQIGLAAATPILTAAQINRDGDSGDLPPRLKNLAQSDALGQDGDVVVTMRNRRNAATICSLEKNRHGVSGMRWHTRFDVNAGRFDQINEEKADELVTAAQIEQEMAR